MLLSELSHWRHSVLSDIPWFISRSFVEACLEMLCKEWRAILELWDIIFLQSTFGWLPNICKYILVIEKLGICIRSSSLIPTSFIYFCAFNIFCIIKHSCLSLCLHNKFSFLKYICTHFIHKAPFFLLRFHNSLHKAALFQIRIVKTFKPPATWGRQSVSHATNAFFAKSTPPVQRNIL